MKTYSEVITISPEIMHGTPVFSGTRVPIQTAIDYFKGGETIDDFLEGFPSVTKEQVLQLLDLLVTNLPVFAA
ncbi:DUF433 domain-containing protein [[Limnothrix rosea] IAM M-220]|uniref:DUF433 domain-containing protein n=1 Tax=[Limnothrix rosea] IAM M-220 TaxID=454133 RepID=UPI000968599B|nr:DUF433 domain-containing protein [[Limnothrix rosea] IAM M-220]OKH18432.1 hypothetical protein NIES208_05570 [[Limnothrix rosea] IAM M-220]